jgi:hypothetical protein
VKIRLRFKMNTLYYHLKLRDMLNVMGISLTVISRTQILEASSGKFFAILIQRSCKNIINLKPLFFRGGLGISTFNELHELDIFRL